MLELLVNSAHGQYIPQVFSQTYDMGSWGVNPEDTAVLQAGPDHELYWETWDKVLNVAKSLDEAGNVWLLHNDCDLFAYSGDTELESFL